MKKKITGKEVSSNGLSDSDNLVNLASDVASLNATMDELKELLEKILEKLPEKDV